MDKLRLIVIAILVILLAIGLYFWKIQPATAPEPNTQVSEGQTTTQPSPQSDLITILSPTPNQLITSPLKLSGEARGNWYFEATAPVVLNDANGKQIAEGYITANGEWMTTEFVAFTGTLTFPKPTTATGELIFQKNNPSGLPENDDQITVPVRFQ